MSSDGRVFAGRAIMPNGEMAAYIATLGTSCAADLASGAGLAIPDGAVTIEDLLYYVSVYSESRLEADLDDGSGTGTSDGGVTIDDLLYFLVRYEAGC